MGTYREIIVKLNKDKKSEQLREKIIMWVEKEEKENRDCWMVVVKRVAWMWIIGFPVTMLFDFLFNVTFPFPVVILITLVVFLVTTKYFAWEEYEYYRHKRTLLETVKGKMDQGVETMMEAVRKMEDAQGRFGSPFVAKNELAIALLRGEIPIKIYISREDRDEVCIFCQNNDYEVSKYWFYGKSVFKANHKEAVLDMDEEVLYLPFDGGEND